ncbi:TPA: hypothetical protein ACFP41_000999 [Neisseria weaveri]
MSEEENVNPLTFDITLESLVNEYNLRIQATKDVDEKANKYLMIISIFVAGFFAVISSSLHEKLRFHYPLELVDILSWGFIAFFLGGSIFSFLAIRNILSTLELVEVANITDLKEKMKEFSQANLEQYKYELICCYQEAINLRYSKIAEKQKPLKLVYPNMQRAIVCILCSCLLLFCIKVVS